MALTIADRVLQTGSANTTVSFTLSGSVSGYQSFSVVGNGNTTYYGAQDGTNWEVGIGTYSTTGPTLTRTTIIASSNSGSAVTAFTTPVTIYVTQPSEYAVYVAGTSIVVPNSAYLGTANGGTGLTSFTANGIVFASTTSVLATATGLTWNGTTFNASAVTSGGSAVLTASNYSGYNSWTTGTFTPNTTGVSTGLNVVNGDITTYRSGGTTGVIYLGNSGSRYLYYDGTNYNMPGGALILNGSNVLTAGNYNSYAPTLTGTGASGTWGIGITGNAATISGTGIAQNVNRLQLFNNQGYNHGTFTSFSAVPDAGNYLVHQDTYTDGPSAINVGGGNTGQYYTQEFGLGNDYATSSYAFQQAIGRNALQPYQWVRSREAGTWTAWTKVAAGYADSSGAANNVAGLVQNGYSSYGNTATTTLRNSYYGLLLGSSTSHINVMADNSGNGGFYREANGVWPLYYLASDDCVGINTSTTNSAYGAYIRKSVYTSGYLVLNGAVTVNPSGSMPGQFARAWASFYSRGSITIYNSVNISSITYSSAGTYTVSFVTAFPSNRYTGAITPSVGTVSGNYAIGSTSATLSTNYYSVFINDTAGNSTDPTNMQVTCFY